MSSQFRRLFDLDSDVSPETLKNIVTHVQAHAEAKSDLNIGTRYQAEVAYELIRKDKYVQEIVKRKSVLGDVFKVGEKISAKDLLPFQIVKDQDFLPHEFIDDFGNIWHLA